MFHSKRLCHLFCLAIVAWIFVFSSSSVIAESCISSIAEPCVPLLEMWDVNPQTVVESFETLAGRGDNVRIQGNLLLPCGATITNNYSYGDSFTPFIVNGGFFGLYPASPYCPDGTAYLGQSNPGMRDDGIWITFPELVTKVGAYFCSATDHSNSTVVLEAYDANGILLDDMVLSNIHYQQWATSFRGFECSTGIKAIRYDGYGSGVLRIDQLAFQTVPEPGTIFLLFLGGLTLFLKRFSKK